MNGKYGILRWRQEERKNHSRWKKEEGRDGLTQNERCWVISVDDINGKEKVW